MLGANRTVKEFTMSDSKKFHYSVNDYDDVRDHLDALWTEFNKIVRSLRTCAPCTDPPDTCGSYNKPKKRKRAQAKKAKK